MLTVKGKGGITATIVADSKSSVDGQRITTFLLTYHRYIHSELMTHRLFSRNAASSRAIPVDTVLALVKASPAIPVHWGKNQAGMQANEECDNKVRDCIRGQMPVSNKEAWQSAGMSASQFADSFNCAGYHKQIVNRLVEPFQMIRVLVTATSFDNFFKLRFHKDAQPEIAELALCMLVGYNKNVPEVLKPGEWHTPFVDHLRDEDGLKYVVYDIDDGQGFYQDVETAIKVSCSCAAQTSYRKADTSIEKAIAIYDKLIGSDPAHSSAFEHCATPAVEYGVTRVNGPYDVMSWQEGITHVDYRGQLWSNNFEGWIQYRALIPNNVCTQFDYGQEVNMDGLEIIEEDENV